MRLKDDKSYPYIRCSMEDTFPRLYMERRVKRQKGSLYFGPYTEAFFVRRMIRLLNQQFKIRDCSNHFMKSRTKPCLSFHIGHCPAPCVNKVNKTLYQQKIEQALALLQGRGQSGLKNMEQQMKMLAKKERFEEASRLRDRIKAITLCKAKQSIVGHKNKNLDILAFYFDHNAFLFQTLHIRSGALIGQNFQYELNQKNIGLTKVEVEEYLCSFIVQYYIDNLAPDNILVGYQKPLKTKTVEKNLKQKGIKQSKKPSKKSLKSKGTLADEKQTLKHEFFLNKPSLEKALASIHGRFITLRKPKGSLEKKLMTLAFKNAYTHFKEQNVKQKSLKETLLEIQKLFCLKTLPKRIECFDISHFQGKGQVASQVVFENGQAKKQDYRRYKIKTVKKIDDFACLKEVLLRRFKGKKQANPNLLVIDGGKGQLNQVVLALKEVGQTDIPVIALAKKRVKADFKAPELKKGKEKFFIPGRKNPILLAKNSSALKLLCYLRDEAHRFAITYHRKSYQKAFFK